MRQQRSKVKVGDNSGIRELRCVQVMSKGRGPNPKGRVGKVMRGSVIKYRSGTKWKRGVRVKGVVVKVSKEQQRGSGMWCRMGSNGVVVVNKKREPRANRSRVVISGERRGKGFAKVLSRSLYAV
jgi:ribosomal protein L14